MSQPVQVGDRVKYTPHECHWNDTCKAGNRQYSFVHHESGGHGKKDSPAQMHLLGEMRQRRPDGSVEMASGAVVRPHAPACSWDAVVTAVHEDGAADLEIQHPRGGVTLGYRRVPCSDSIAPHTWQHAE